MCIAFMGKESATVLSCQLEPQSQQYSILNGTGMHCLIAYILCWSGSLGSISVPKGSSGTLATCSSTLSESPLKVLSLVQNLLSYLFLKIVLEQIYHRAVPFSFARWK